MQRSKKSISTPRVIIHTPESRHGAARYVSELVIALGLEGAPIVLFCPVNFVYQSEVRAAGVEIVHAPARGASKGNLFRRILKNVKFVAQASLSQYRITRPGDVVHFQFPLHLPLGFVFVVLVRSKGASIVLTAHDPLPHKWRFPSMLRGFEYKMLRRFYGLCDGIIVHNDSGKEVLVREFKVPMKRISVIPHGPFSEAAPEAPFPGFECLRLLVFGSIRQNKGVHLAIRAVQAANAVSRLPVRLTIAGLPYNSSESRYWEECKELIAQAPECIDVIGAFVPDEEVSPLLARHHALLLPYISFSSESGVAALALSNCRPILATRGGGLGELLKLSNCGIPIDSPDVEPVTRAIVHAIELGPEKLHRMASDGRRFLTETRSWPSIARKTLQVYSQLQEGGEGRPSPIPRRPPLVANIISREVTTPAMFDVTQPLPSFFIVGPARTGTSWLHMVLNERTLLPKEKETYFFDSNFHKGFDWYQARYAPLMEGGPMGEVAPTYFASSKARERIARTIPGAKIVCIFRNPVERVWSLYRLRRAHARIPWSFEEAIVRDPELMETSRYATHLKAWQAAFGRDQVRVIMYEDLRKDPQSYVDTVVDFIGIPRFQLAEEQFKYVYSSEGEKLSYPRNQHVTRIARATADWLVDVRLAAVVSGAKKLAFTKKLLKGDRSFEKLSPDVVLRLKKMFLPEIEQLEAMLNRDLSAWK